MHSWQLARRDQRRCEMPRSNSIKRIQYSESLQDSAGSALKTIFVAASTPGNTGEPYGLIRKRLNCNFFTSLSLLLLAEVNSSGTMISRPFGPGIPSSIFDWPVTEEGTNGTRP